MQFGKVSGLGLIVLGILLCGLQGARYVAQQGPALPDQSITRPERKTSSLTGIVGAASLVTGIVLFISARRKDEPDQKNAVK